MWKAFYKTYLFYVTPCTILTYLVLRFYKEINAKYELFCPHQHYLNFTKYKIFR